MICVWVRAILQLLIRIFYPFRIKIAIDGTSILNMRMVSFTETKIRVTEARPKSTAGGGGFSGIAVIVFAIATITIRAPIGILVSDL